MITDSYELKIDFGSGYRTVATHFEGFTRTEVCHKELKSADNTCRLTVAHDTELENLLRGIDEDGVKAYVTKNGERIFTGYVRRTFKITNTGRVQPTQLELVSPSFLLKRNVMENYRKMNATVSTIVADLLKLSGYTDADLVYMPVVSTLIPYFSVEADTETYYDLVATLLWEYGYLLEFNASGYPCAYEMQPSSMTATQTFRTVTDSADGNILGSLSQNVEDESYQKFSIEWTSTKTLEGVSIFSDTTNATTTHKCEQTVNPRTYYGESEADSEGLYLEYSCENYDLLYAYGVSLDWSGESNLEKKEFTDYGTRAFLKIFNSSYSAARKITKLDVNGTAIVKESTNVAKIQNSDGVMSQTYSYQSKYIFDKVNADRLCSVLAHYYGYADYSYNLSSKDDFEVGSLVNVVDPQTGSVLCRITERTVDEYKGVIQYKLEGVSEYSPATVTTESHKVPESNNSNVINQLMDLQNTVSEIEVNNSYTLDLSPEMQGVSVDNSGAVVSTDSIKIKAWLYQYDAALSGVTFSAKVGNVTVGTWSGNTLTLPVSVITGDTTQVEVTAVYGNINRTAIATITKIYAGESSWYQYDMELSDYAVYVDNEGSIVPDEISATKWKRSQEGQSETETGQIVVTVDDDPTEYVMNSYHLDDGSGYNPVYDYKKEMVPQFIALDGDPLTVGGVAIVTYSRSRGE